MSRKRGLPTDDEVWSRVRAFAEQRASDKKPVPTLSEGVNNLITDVVGARIERASEQGKKNTTPIYRGELLRVWRDLVKHGSTRKARPNYFTLALLPAALPDLVDDHGDGTIALRWWTASSPSDRPYRYDEAASERPPRGGLAANDRELRESDAHWRIKHYINEEPSLALAKLPGSPYTRSALELPLRVPTKDRIDVVVRDCDGRRVLIEVKPNVGDRDIGLYAQAAKYRAIWRVLHDLGETDVRCALAAPKIPAGLAKHMREQHLIESVAVKVPPDFEAPPRD
ncbi:hypothetical protein [Enhygromyxa salina]|uniref:Uncharacterized protein n=1 Tax=Enhygromyxa salina TaxID=215803 RepID=A0A2S9XUE1_9BACT|nr:hypothetical protein [Enhygromyxa salina]PRP96454.1 hypothetical protein ENSA7_72690 [Enhygromyxa salina]